MDRWVGKVAIVTGASSGIGEAIAKQLVNNGLKVVGLARRKDRLDALANSLSGKKGQFYPYQADITKEEDILKAFAWTKENVGSLHVLVNNAGTVKLSTFADLTTEDAKAMFDLNVLALTIACREALRIFKENNTSGHIININSLAGHSILDYPTVAVYSSTKHTVTALTKYIRLEMDKLKIGARITSISPGLVETEIISDAVLERLKQNPHYAGLKSEDIANATIYVLSSPPHCQIEELTLSPVYAPV